MRHRLLMVGTLACFVILSERPARGQDLEPRAYSASPVGTTFLVAALVHSTGDVIFDPSIPVSDVSASVNGLAMGFGRTFGLAGRLANASLAVPYSWGTIQGRVFEQTGQVSRDGMADMRIRLSVNLRGAPALTPSEFAKRTRGALVGASLTVAAPIGEYYPSKLINLGTNRWAFKPEVGLSKPAGPWDLETYVGIWFFTENPVFFPGTVVRRQDTMFVWQGHASYTFRRRAWLAGDATWYRGGTVHLNDGPGTGQQNNLRYGATLSWPLGRRQSIKASYTAGAIVRSGSDFRTVGITWQMFFIDHPRP
jgi:hypothetical protein